MSNARQLRQQRGLSIAALSHEILDNASTLSSVERRKIAASKNVRRKLSEFFSVPESQLFDTDGLAI